MDFDTGDISCCFDEESKEMYDDYKENGLSDTSVALANATIRNGGFAGSTVLEIGCGFGALSLELVQRGASSAVGIDLSPKMVQMAKSLASEKGLGDKTSFVVGDGARTELPRSTTVILDAVLCCYPDPAALIENSSAAAERHFAISIPDDTRFLTRLFKLVLPFQALVFRGDRFRFFVHPTRALTTTLEKKGFKMVSKSPVGWIWSAYFFSRP